MRRKRFGRSDGQTLVEFALVLPIFLLIVMGIFEFGRAITYWHDLNNTAQVAARYAVVNRYPGCPGTCSRLPGLGEERSQLRRPEERPVDVGHDLLPGRRRHQHCRRRGIP